MKSPHDVLAPPLRSPDRQRRRDPDMSDFTIPRTHDGDTAPAESSAAVAADKYDQMLALADLFDSSGSDMRARARLGDQVLRDDDVADTEELSRSTFGQAEEDIRAATTGKHGLLTRSVELDADALVVRATVLTYRWIDELQQAAYKTLGSIAGRAIGYLAPEVALGGAIVSAGLIETDALDRDSVTAYLNELAENNPELMDHMSDGGGLLEGLHMRSLLTAGVLASENGAHAARGGLRAIGVDPFPADGVSAFRDSAGAFVEAEAERADGGHRRGPGATLARGADGQPRRRGPQDQHPAGRSRSLHRLPPRTLRRRVGSPATGRRRPHHPGGAGGACHRGGCHRRRRSRHARRLGVGRHRGRGGRGVPVVGEVHGRPGRDGRLPVCPGAVDPRADARAVAGGSRRSGRAARLAHQRQDHQPPHRGLRRHSGRRHGTPTSPAPVPPTAPTTPSCARRSPGCRSWATSPVEPA